MIRNLKVLGLALIALLAISVIGASGASAQFHCEEEKCRLTVNSNGIQKFSPNSTQSPIECTTVVVDNSVFEGKPGTTTNTEVTATPTYSNCENFLGAAVTVDMNDCIYRFTLEDSATSGEVHIECPGTGIQVTIGSICTYEIDPQTVGTVTYKNVGTGTTREVELEPDVTNITVTRTTNDLFCPAGGSPGTGNAGKYTGNLTVTAESLSTGKHVGVWVS